MYTKGDGELRRHSIEGGGHGRHFKEGIQGEVKRHRHEEQPAEGMHRRGGGRGGHGRGRGGAQTFRRGRAIEFYKQLESKNETLKLQLESKELESIHPIIAGELKAVQAIMAEFKVAFGLTDEENTVTENEEISDK